GTVGIPNITNNCDKITTRRMKTTYQGISRATLGEIGNRVSTLTVSSFKDEASKKVAAQPLREIVTRAQAAKTKVTSAINNKNSEQVAASKEHSKSLPPSEVEVVPKKNLLPSDLAPIKDSDELTSLSKDVTSMDISSDGRDAFSKAMFAHQIENIDADDKADPQHVSVYVNPIYSYMRQIEKIYNVRPNYLEGTELTGKMRAILIDWLCQVHHKFRLLQETFYLTVAIIDRYLQVKPCIKLRLQLVGVTAMLIASKYEEMHSPQVADFVYITDNAYTKQDILDMEQDILRTIDFCLGRPHCLNFLRRNSKAGQVSAAKHMLAKYLMELALIEYDLLHYRPSLLAAAALYLSMFIIDGSTWSPTLQFYSSYSEEELIPLAQCLAKLVVGVRNPKLTAVRTKYSDSKFMKIAFIPQLKSQALKDFAASENTH
ncbi:unnamed protein product, partial [Candidula unifasciata]